MIGKHSKDCRKFRARQALHAAVRTAPWFVLFALLICFAVPSGGLLLAQGNVSIDPMNGTFSAIGGTLDINVTADPETAWTAVSSEDWLAVVAGASGTGNGTVRLSAAVNESQEVRTAQVAIGNSIAFLVQEPLVAIVRFLPDTVTVGAAGARRTITVQVDPSNLPWRATSNVPWITVLTPQDVGSGSVTFIVATNPSATTRVGTINAVNSTLRVTQAGGEATFSLSSTGVNLPFQGGSGEVAVTTQPENADWVAYSLVPWISVANSQFAGNGTVAYTVQQNPEGDVRQGAISIAGMNFVVSQAANPDPSTPDPTEPPEPTSTFSLSSGIVSIAATVNAPQEVSQSLAIGSTGEALSFAVEVEGAPWLRARRTSGTTPDNIIFTATPTGLAVGTYFGTIRIRSTSNTAVVQLPARLRINPPPGTPEQPPVSPASLFFSRVVGEPIPGQQVIRVGRPGTVASTTATLGTPVTWLQLFTSSTQQGTEVTVGVSTQNLLPGLYENEIVLNSPSSQFSEIRIPVSYRVQMAAMDRPYISSAGVVGAAGFRQGLAPNAWVSIFGSNLAKTTRSWRAGDFSGGTLPTSLDGVEVMVAGKKAAIAFVSPTQLNILVPAMDTLGRAEIVVSSDGEISPSAVAYLTETLPDFFTFSPMAGKYAAALHLDNAPVGPTDLFSTGTPARPAKPGEVIQVFGSGFGATNPPVDPGRLFSGAAPLIDFEGLEIWVGGIEAAVGFSGLSGTGLYQFNVTVPTLPAGDHEITARIGNSYTRSGVFIRVQP
jgi:uncharacterized protein (TIGR03437 family)